MVCGAAFPFGRAWSWAKRVERAAKGGMASFELLDGSRYFYDPGSWELFMHWYEYLMSLSERSSWVCLCASP